MSEFKGTPGPWERGGGESGGGELLVYCNNSLGSAICDATSHYSVFDKATRIANLDLIAAAPELLEALQDMLSGWKYIRQTHGDLYGVGWDRAEQKATEAIKKALGQ